MLLINSRSGARRHRRLHPDGIQDLLQPRHAHGLIIALFVPANRLFADTETLRQFRL